MNTQEKLGRVAFEMKGRIAILTIDNPPVNAGSHAVRVGLIDGIEKAVGAEASAAVIVGAGRCFVAGSDLREFGKPLGQPELPDVIAAIEAAPFPVIAALHGVALGGGLELALGCDYRIATAETLVGLPEVSLGFVPGAGGTQRLPRLTGQARAIALICDAARIPAKTAMADGIVDAVVDGDLVDAAVNFVGAGNRPKRLTLNLTPPYEDADAVNAAAARALRRGKGRPNVAEAIRLIRAAGSTDSAATLRDERSVFQDMRVGEDAFALRYLFFAERRAATVASMKANAAPVIASVGVVGGGTMGQGIAKAVLAAGLPVTLVERDAAALDTAQAAIRASLDAAVAKGRLTCDVAASRKAALSGGVGLGALEACELVIEAVFEDMDVKRAVLVDLEAVLRPGAIIATNTSYLDIDVMTDGLQNPSRIVGLHFFSPADVMPLLEVVRSGQTSDPVLAAAMAFARKLRKQPVVSQVAEGFIGNRIYAAYRRRAELFLLDGATPQQVDAAITDFGFAMGPFAVADMSGLDIAWAMRKRQSATRDPKARYVTIPDTLCEAGRFGRKTGRGWYAYDNGKPASDPAVEAVIAEARDVAGITPIAFDAATIQRQLLAAIVNEAACLLAEGVAQCPSDVDVVLTSGYGFPRWRGGPLYWAAQQDRAMIRADLTDLADAVGHGFQAGPVDDTLDQIKTGQET